MVAIDYVFSELDSTVTLDKDPLFAITYTAPSLAADAEIETLNIPASNFNKLFLFRTDADDVNDVANLDIQYAVNPVNWNNPGTGSLGFDLSQAVVTAATCIGGSVYSDPSNRTVPFDMVRHIALKVTGGYAGADLFSNEADLRKSISDLSGPLSKGIARGTKHLVAGDIVGILDNSANVGYARADLSYDDETDGESPAKPFVFKDNTITARTNIAREAFLQTYTNDLSRIFEELSGRASHAGNFAADSSKIVMSIPFEAGDSLAFKVTINPKTAKPLGDNTITSRSYALKATLQ